MTQLKDTRRLWYVMDRETGEVMFTFNPDNETAVLAMAAIAVEKYTDPKYVVYNPRSEHATNALGLAETILLDRKVMA